MIDFDAYYDMFRFDHMLCYGPL